MLCCPMNKVLYVVMEFVRKLQPFCLQVIN